MHLFVKNDKTPDLKSAKKLINKFQEESSNEEHFLIESYFDLVAYFRTLKFYLKLFVNYFKVKKYLRKYCYDENQLNLYPIFKSFFVNGMLGPEAANNAIRIILFERIDPAIFGQIGVLYLMENQAWEKALNSQIHQRNVRTFGVIHIFMRFWDIRFASMKMQARREKGCSSSLPDYILSNSPASTKQILKYGVETNRVQEVEALRYLISPINMKVSNSDNLNKRKILVLGEYSADLVRNQLEFIRRMKKLMDPEIEVLFRMHPSTPFNLTNYDRANLQISNKDLYADLEYCDEVICYSASTVAINIVVNDIKISVYKYAKVLDGMAGIKVFKFQSLEEYLSNYNDYTYENKQENNFRDLINADPKLQKWNRFILDLSKNS
jgi:surface carbohydrate biosynthesis protein (TIGR04326 family)